MGDGQPPWEDRFRILGRLGEGGMGVVYEAIEASTRTPIALKVMRTADPKLLQRFKREFRALADIHHPNLVALYELFASADRWAFSMELVRGASLSELLRASIPTSSELATDSGERTPPTLGMRPDGRAVPVSSHPPQLPESQLLAIARQLASGVAHLHATGHVHCDIKPSNVLVGDDGRVALCDFGLIDAHRDAGSRARAIGTVAYMSPEQARRASLTDASDWYAFGAVLYVMLTGRPPFVGEDAAVLAAKQRETPARVASINPRAPADLAALCEALLVPDRRDRPRGADVLAWLGARPAAPAVAAHVDFVGRHEERARLADALAAGGDAETAITLVHGASGIGKSTLVRRAIDEACRVEPKPLVLAGRCYQQESVPYKAFDPIIDELVDARLRARDPAIVASFAETDTAPLARMFPVLRRLTGEREALDTDPTLAPHEARELGITALRALFTALARQRATIVWIDDAQWMDPASARLLRGLLRAPGSPPIALVLSHRGLASETWREAVVEMRARDGGVRDEIAVEPLPFDDAVEMAARALGGDRARAAWVAREAAGNPFFIAELAQANLGGSGDVGIADVIARRVSALGAAARATLDTIVVAGRPLPPAIVARSAGVTELDAALHELRALRLVQTRGDRATPTLEAYHDRIRTAVAALLDDDARARLHRGLARAYATIAPGDDEALAVHWHGAGAPDRAAPHAERAAIAASGAFAFDRAAALFRLALAGDHEPDHRQHLRRRLAQALVDAGRAMEAAEEFLVAAAAAAPEDALDLRRQAAEQLLLSGHVDRGLIEIEGVLRALGLRLAATPRRALLSLVGTRIGLRLRGLRAARPGAPRLGSHDGAALRRLDALWAVSTGLSLIDNIRGADCQARFLREALRVGEPVRIARGLAMESGYVAAAGEGARAKAIALADRAHALADAQGDPYTLALVQLVRGIGSFVRGDFPQAIPACHQADVMLATSCVGVEWERTAAAFFRIGGTYFTGDLHALRREVPALLRAAIDRGNLYGATGLRVWYSNAAWLAADDPVAAQAATDEGRAGWSYAGYHLQHHYVALAQIQIALYRGDAATARACASTAYRQLGVMRGLQMVRFEAHELLARSLLAVAAGGDRAAARQALRHARVVRGIDHAFTRGVGSAHVASALTLLGDLAGARAAWATADQELERAGMRAHGAAARWRCALAADDPRAADAALDELAALGARAPDRFARMLMPGAPAR